MDPAGWILSRIKPLLLIHFKIEVKFLTTTLCNIQIFPDLEILNDTQTRFKHHFNIFSG